MNEIKKIIKDLYNEGLTIGAIIRVCPCRDTIARQLIKEMKTNGELEKRSLHQITKNKIKELHSQGLNRVQIMQELHISYSTVNQYLCDLGLKVDVVEYPYRKISDKTKYIIQYIKDNPTKSRYSIAKELGVSKQYISIVEHKFIKKEI